MIQNKIKDLLECDVHRLDYVNRYQTIPTVVQETTSSHSFWVSYYSLALLSMIGCSDTDFISKVLSYAIVHDIEECVTGDVVRPFKHSNEQLKQAIDDSEFEEFRKHVSEVTLNTVAFARAESNEAVKAIVKVADVISVVRYMITDLRTGNTNAKKFVNIMIEDLKSYITKSEPIVYGGRIILDPRLVYGAMLKTVLEITK